MELVRLTNELAHSAAECERLCLKEAWSEGSIAEMAVRSDGVYCVCVDSGTVCGVAGAICVSGEANITNVAVLPRYRMKGIAKALMRMLLAECKENACNTAFLEVNENNTAAMHLYADAGFYAVGRRKGFYGDADGIVMRCDI